MAKDEQTISPDNDDNEALPPDADLQGGDAVPSPDSDIEAADDTGQAGDEPEERRDQWGAVLREVLETVLLAVVIWGVINLLTARYEVNGPSMEDNLFTGYRLIVSRLTYEFGEPERGDVIVFSSPQTGEKLVKRVIGLPGETVTIHEEEVLIDGQSLDEPYISSVTFLPYEGQWTLPEGYYFLMGDNRARSSDSRRWGLVPEKDIVGKVWLIYWPLDAVSAVAHYHNYMLPEVSSP